MKRFMDVRPLSAESETRWSEVCELLLEYASSLSVDLCFQDLMGELAGLPGDYAQTRGTNHDCTR